MALSLAFIPATSPYLRKTANIPETLVTTNYGEDAPDQVADKWSTSQYYLQHLRYGR